MTDIWNEYDKAAEWCAKHGFSGDIARGQLPKSISCSCLLEINSDRDAFKDRVKDCAYAQAMNLLNLPDR